MDNLIQRSTPKFLREEFTTDLLIALQEYPFAPNASKSVQSVPSVAPTKNFPFTSDSRSLKSIAQRQGGARIPL